MIAPVLQAIAPLVVLMALGAWIKRTLVRPDEVWSGIESIVYYILMPALLFSNISQTDLTDLPWGALLTSLYVPTLALSAIAVAPMLWRNSLTPATRSSLFQGISRFNLYISLSLAVSLFDERSFALVGLLAAALVLLVNVTCVSALVLLNEGRLESKRLVKELTQNPLILACIAGILANELTLALPEFAWVTLDRLGQTALPISLLAIGAGLSLNKFTQGMSLNIYSSLMQMVVKPMIAFVVISATGLAPEFGVLVFLMMATPTAPSSYILARKLGGDAPAMASMIAFQTCVGFGTLLVMLTLWQVMTGVSLA